MESTRPRRRAVIVLRVLGFILFLASFAVPGGGYGEIGLSAFIVMPYAIWYQLMKGYPWDSEAIVLIFSGTIAWLDNFTVFFRLPAVAALLAMVAPWVLFPLMLADSNALLFLPFYPWALGISLIQAARLVELRRSVQAFS